MRSIAQPPAGPGAGRYLAGRWAFGGAVWVSGTSEKKRSISGAEQQLEKTDMSTWRSDENHRIGGGKMEAWKVQFGSHQGCKGCSSSKVQKKREGCGVTHASQLREDQKEDVRLACMPRAANMLQR